MSNEHTPRRGVLLIVASPSGAGKTSLIRVLAIALRDAGVMVHAMGKAAAARITLRSVDELEALAASVPPMAYDLDNYASLGLLADVLDVEQVTQPTAADLAHVKDALGRALADIAASPRDLRNRLGADNRAVSSQVREALRAQW